MGAENTTTYLTLSRERGLVITAESKLSLSHQQHWVRIAPPDFASQRGSGRTIQEELALGLIVIKTVSSSVTLMM